jgi:hypothetical protein
MNLQRINVKLFVDSPDVVPVDSFLPIFARWRKDQSHPSGWVDMADYAHVTRGPGIMMIGQQGNLSLDCTDPGPGILYANKKDLDGDDRTRILDSFRRALALARTLIDESGYPDALAPRPGVWQLTFNDRLETPNNEQTDQALRPAVDAALDRMFGQGDYTVVPEKDSLRRYGFLIQSDKIVSLDAISSNL